MGLFGLRDSKLYKELGGGRPDSEKAKEFFRLSTDWREAIKVIERCTPLSDLEWEAVADLKLNFLDMILFWRRLQKMEWDRRSVEAMLANPMVKDELRGEIVAKLARYAESQKKLFEETGLYVHEEAYSWALTTDTYNTNDQNKILSDAKFEDINISLSAIANDRAGQEAWDIYCSQERGAQEIKRSWIFARERQWTGHVVKLVEGDAQIIPIVWADVDLATRKDIWGVMLQRWDTVLAYDEMAVVFETVEGDLIKGLESKYLARLFRLGGQRIKTAMFARLRDTKQGEGELSSQRPKIS